MVLWCFGAVSRPPYFLNAAHIRQSGPDSGLGSEDKIWDVQGALQVGVVFNFAGVFRRFCVGRGLRPGFLAGPNVEEALEPLSVLGRFLPGRETHRHGVGVPRRARIEEDALRLINLCITQL